jgi:hypothetical protein
MVGINNNIIISNISLKIQLVWRSFFHKSYILKNNRIYFLAAVIVNFSVFWYITSCQLSSV